MKVELDEEEVKLVTMALSSLVAHDTEMEDQCRQLGVPTAAVMFKERRDSAAKLQVRIIELKTETSTKGKV